MTPRSRTGKMLQGIFGKLGKKQPPPAAPTPDFLTRQVSSIEPDEFPTVSVVDEDEDTNWDDEESPDIDNTPTPRSPIAKVPTPPPPPPPPSSTPQDANEDWEEALPAPTVKTETSTTLRRKENKSQSQEDWWEDIPTVTAPVPEKPTANPSTDSKFDRAIGLWTAMLQQLRRILPAPLKGLSDAILTAIVVVLVTIGIWTVDGLFTPAPAPQTIESEPPAIVAPATPPALPSTPQISPEQAFIQSIQAQIGEITGKYPDDIIQTLQVDLPHNRLVVRLNNVWYLISDGKQDEVTDRMWAEALANHFTKLDVQDPNGQLIARSPVVGKHMIIFQRRAGI